MFNDKKQREAWKEILLFIFPGLWSYLQLVIYEQVKWARLFDWFDLAMSLGQTLLLNQKENNNVIKMKKIHYRRPEVISLTAPVALCNSVFEFMAILFSMEGYENDVSESSTDPSLVFVPVAPSFTQNGVIQSIESVKKREQSLNWWQHVSE